MKTNLDYIIENYIKTSYNNIPLDEATAYAASSFGDIKNYSTNGLLDHLNLGLIKRVFDTFITKDIVGVQPISGPIGLCYALRYYADQTYSGSTNTELGTSAIDSSYSGSYVTSAGEVLGSGPTNADGLGIGSGTQINEISVKIEKQRAESKIRKLRSRMSLEVIQDIMYMFNENLKNELIYGIVNEISKEIDMEVLDKIESIAGTDTIDYSAIVGGSDHDKNNSFMKRINSLCNDIGQATNHGVGNFVVASKNVSTIIESSEFFSVMPLPDGEEYVSETISQAGRIGNKKLFRNIY
jgi:ferredoxin-fold anticodon binding domain-containing protein